MSLYGTMRTGVSGMNAQANRLSTVGDNIANASTAGYKKASTQFSSLILPSGEGSYNSGGVTTNVRYSISDQGTFTYTTSSTDLAINGSGFFIVEGSDGIEYLTRAGNFTGMSDGTLQNAAGFTLLGYEYSSTEDPTMVINGFDGLTEINLSSGSLMATASRTGVLDANLPAGDDISVRYSTSLIAYDSQGNARLIGVDYVKQSPNNVWEMWLSEDGQPICQPTPAANVLVNGSVSPTATGPFPYSAGNIVIDDAGQPRQIMYNFTRVSSTEWEVDVVDATDMTLMASTTLVFDSTGRLSSPPTLVTPPTTSAGDTIGPMTIDFSQLRNDSSEDWRIPHATADGAQNSWGFNILFDENGKLIGPASVKTKPIWRDGSLLEGLTLDIAGSTQLASEFKVTNGKIDGNAASNVVGHEISDDGIVYLKYSNGKLEPKYRIAMADVQSPDQLKPLAGNVYTQSNDSGVIVMGFAGNGSYGTILSGALEDSNVDIAEELTSMIESQRNYTANSKVFQTGSELLEVLVNLKR